MSLKAAVHAEEHDVSSTLSDSDAEEETALTSPALAMTETTGQLEEHTTLPPSQKGLQKRTKKQVTFKSAKATLAALTRKKSIAAVEPTTRITTSIGEGLTTSTPQAEKEETATSAAAVVAATEKKQGQQDDSAEEPDEGEPEEPEEPIKDTKISKEVAQSTVTSDLDETARSSISDDDYDMERVSPDSGKNLQPPDIKGQSGLHKKKANVGAAVLLVCGIILSLLLSILVVLISMMISAQKNPRLGSNTQSAAVSSAKV